jgi:hypothetical protein
VDELNQGSGVDGQTTLTITDRAGRSVTISKLDTVDTVRELIHRLEAEADANDVAVAIDFNPAGNGLRVIDRSRDSDGKWRAMRPNGCASRRTLRHRWSPAAISSRTGCATSSWSVRWP